MICKENFFQLKKQNKNNNSWLYQKLNRNGVLNKFQIRIIFWWSNVPSVGVNSMLKKIISNFGVLNRFLFVLIFRDLIVNYYQKTIIFLKIIKIFPIYYIKILLIFLYMCEKLFYITLIKDYLILKTENILKIMEKILFIKNANSSLCYPIISQKYIFMKPILT